MKYIRVLESAVLVGCVAMMVSCNRDNDEPGVDVPGFGDEVSRRVIISAVSYNPAPGQFVNEMPVYEPGDTRKTIEAKALEAINKGSLISLGALGGSITLTLEKPIFHDASKKFDFRVLGNSYITGSNERGEYGSSEPGLVEVMEDSNGNGLPDDIWYRFVGDMGDEITKVNITYTPAAEPTASNWVEWETSDGKTGALTCNLAYHEHTYFPQWLFDDTDNAEMTFETFCLPPNGFRDTSTGLFHQICYRGFADSYPNNDDRSAFSLRDAVDANGKPAHITKVDFIRITTAVIDANGPLGETSTEVGGIEAIMLK